MKDNLMQKMFGVFESIIKSEGATALTNERIKKCCEENGVDYEEFSASVLEEVLSVIGVHSGNSGDVLLSELSSKDLDAVSGGTGTFRRGTASALAALSLCGATRLSATDKEGPTNSQIVPGKVASRHLKNKKRSGNESIIKSQAAQNIAKYLSIAGLSAFLTYSLMSRMNGDASPLNPAQDQTKHLPASIAKIRVYKPKGKSHNGFLPESEEDPAKDWFGNKESGYIITPQNHGKKFRIAAFLDTLDYCQNKLGFSVKKIRNIRYTDEDVWESPAGQHPPVVINKDVKSVRVVTPLDPKKCANILITNGRSLQSMICMSQMKEKEFDMSKSAVLDYANFFDPGGGPFIGCAAQEESICRITNLYPLLCNESLKKQFYGSHKTKSKKYIGVKDLNYWKSIGTFRDCIYVPRVQQIKNDYGASRIGGFINNGPTFNIIAAAAPDLRNDSPVDTTAPDYRECFKKLWRQIISTACTQDNENLIAGALGCGAFRNDPQVVAATFFDVLMNEGPDQNTRWAEMLKNVVLPIYIYNGASQDAVNYAYFLIEASKYEGLNIERFDLDCPE